MRVLRKLVVFLVIIICSCSSATELLPCENRVEEMPFIEGEVRVLVLVPWPDERNDSGWDEGYALLAAGRMAQAEVNGAGLLPGYTLRLIERGHEACNLQDTTCGMRNLVKYGVDPIRAVAVAGMYCSTSTLALSSFAGRDELNLLQLTASNSPVFELSNFPRLWRFLESASVYSDMIIDLMDRFGWSNITLVQDYESVFYASIGELIEEKINASSDKNIIYSTSILNNKKLIDDSLQGIRNASTRVIVVTALSHQLAQLICMADAYEMYYPDYLWIISDFLPEHLERENRCSREQLYRVLNGSIMTYYNLHPPDNSTILVSGQPYSDFRERYREEVERVKIEFDDPSVIGDRLYGGLLYDQIWALALSLNKSLSNISDANISLTDPGINRARLTEMIEQELARLDFQGATNRINFTEKRDIPTSIKLYRILDMKYLLVGNYSLVSDTRLNLSFEEYSDEITTMNYNVIGLPVAIPMYVVSGLVTLMVFVMMCLLLYYRHKPEIKATSPSLSLLMYVGCYFLCLASFGRILLASSVNETFFTVNCNIQIVLIVNGFNFLFLTLLAKLLRINFIFNNISLKELGRAWKNSMLATTVFLISLASNVVFLVWFSIDPLQWDSNQRFVIEGNKRYYEVNPRCTSTYSLYWYLIYIVYQVIILLMVIIVTIFTRRISYRNFKDTKKTNFFVFVIVIVYISFVCGWWIFREINNVKVANIFPYVIMVFAVISCQVILFCPKFLTLVCSSVKRRASIVSLNA